MTRRIILDVDTGSDDAVAIILAVARPELEVVACTSAWGNVDIERATRNTGRVLGFAGAASTSLYRGLAGPFGPVPSKVSDEVRARKRRVHADRIDLPPGPAVRSAGAAVEWLVEELRATTEPLTLVLLAPLTNVAAAVTLDPRIVDAVDEVVLMGGGHAIGNVTASAEANIWHDPVAADVVFRAGFERLVVIPLDATHRAFVSRAHVDELRRIGTAHAIAVAGLAEHMIDAYDDMGWAMTPGTAPLHDALCIAYLVDPTVVELRGCHAAVETTGRLTYGRTVFDLRAPSEAGSAVHVALDGDSERFFAFVRQTLVAAG